jgi:hypothetical protein
MKGRVTVGVIAYVGVALFFMPFVYQASWTRRMIKKLGYDPKKGGDDGIFWMSFEDGFCENYAVRELSWGKGWTPRAMAVCHFIHVCTMVSSYTWVFCATLCVLFDN